MLSQLHALLIGVNNYKSEKLKNYPLHGCLNDVQRVSLTLNTLFPGVLRETILTEDLATKAGIIQAFRRELVEPAKQWAESGKPQPGPAFLFHFSGHGSLARDVSGTKPSGFDETIVPFDSRQADVFDLRDWELGALIDELGEFTSNITIVLDCCHAGSGTRSAGRMCEPDLRIPPSGHGEVARRTKVTGLRSQRETKMADYVLLAACDATQIAQEYHDSSGGEPVIYGAMTYALTEILGSASIQSLTYRELHELTTAKVREWYPNQSPQCEGDRDRQLFSSQRIRRDLKFSVIVRSPDGCAIDGGQIHGFVVGDELDVYPPESRLQTQSGAAIGRVRVAHTGVATSQCDYVTGHAAIEVRSRLASARVQFADSDDTRFARQREVLEIRNSQRSSLQGLVVCEMRRSERSGLQGQEKNSEVTTGIPVVDGSLKIEAGSSVCFVVRNESARPLFIQILSLGYDGSISRIWPKLTGEQVALAAGKTLQTSRFRLMFHPDDKSTMIARGYIKLFAATVPMDVDMLCTGNRSSAGTLAAEDWTTAELSYSFSRSEEPRI